MERSARALVVLLLAAALAIPLWGRWFSGSPLPHTVTIHARLAVNGGWSPDVLEAKVGEPLALRLTSDDVTHGFAVGQLEGSSVDVEPGKWVTTSLTFDQPGTYTYYCTRWCGPDHWRMRGTIEVSGEGEPRPAAVPRYLEYGIDIDAPEPAAVIPETVPSAHRGRRWRDRLPDYAFDEATYWRNSPAELWTRLRDEPMLQDREDMDIWDAVAWIWSANTTPEALAIGSRLYEQEAAAAHGEEGRGDGVMVRDLPPYDDHFKENGHSAMQPPDYTDPYHMFGASPARLEGKMLRGGMGTGMPAYGEIFTPAEIEALVAYLYTFVMPVDGVGVSSP